MDQKTVSESEEGTENWLRIRRVDQNQKNGTENWIRIRRMDQKTGSESEELIRKLDQRTIRSVEWIRKLDQNQKNGSENWIKGLGGRLNGSENWIRIRRVDQKTGSKDYTVG